MSDARASLAVARWEFRRFVKPKQVLWSLVLTIVAGGAGYGMSWIAQRNSRATATVHVVDLAGTGREAFAPDGDGLTFVLENAADEDALRARVASGDLKGLLIVREPDSAELVVPREPAWRAALEARLSAAARARRLRKAGLSAEELQALLAPVRAQVTYTTQGGGRAARMIAVAVIVAVVYGIFLAGAYVFVSITGEKQLRVTEQVMSAISPQAWIDGKIVGLAAVSAVGVATVALGVLVFLAGRALAQGNWGLDLGGAGAGTALLIALFGLLGFLMWLAFLGAVAATVDDPNTSTRGPLLFVPALFSLAALLVLRNPDSILARVLSLLPITSPSVMPARLALTSVAWWEVALALALLGAAIWFLRRAAGKIFAVAMLLYGKEPSWSEMRRWLEGEDA